MSAAGVDVVPSSALIDCARVSLSIDARTLVRNLDFRILPGEIWCMLGPNGVGKTTLLHALCGLRPVQAGAVRLGGKALAEWRLADAARQRGFLPQAVHDAFSASVLDVVMMGRYPHVARWQWEGEGDRDAALAALAAVDLSGFADRDVVTLSGGERQRVAIAALLAQNPPLLLLDEPVSHLDLHHQVHVLRNLRSMVDGGQKGILFSVHDLNLAARFASHALIFMPDGGVVQGPVAEVMTEDALSLAFGHRVSRVQLGDRILFLPE